MEKRKTPPVLPEQKGVRLDKFLSLCFPDFSRNRLENLIKDGAVEEESSPSFKVKEGMTFTLTPPDVEEAKPIAEDIPLDILYEDEDLIVLNKEAGQVVHPGAGNPQGTLVNALLYHCGDSLSGIGGVKRPGIVHRIDKETSGLLVVAKNDTAHHRLAKQFEKHTIERTYQAFCWGRMNPMEGTIEGAIGRSTQNRQKMGIIPEGKHAITHYKTLELSGNSLVSFMEFKLETGRTHQIRVHMKSKGHPLIGDKLYGKNPQNAPAFLRHFPRQALHAFSLGFIHPRTKEFLLFKREIPEDMRAIFNEMRNF